MVTVYEPHTPPDWCRTPSRCTAAEACLCPNANEGFKGVCRPSEDAWEWEREQDGAADLSDVFEARL